MDFTRRVKALFRDLTDLFRGNPIPQQLPAQPPSESEEGISAPESSVERTAVPPSPPDLDDESFLAENMGQIVPLSLEIARLNAPLAEERNSKGEGWPVPSREKVEKAQDDENAALAPAHADASGGETEKSPEPSVELQELAPFAQNRVAVSLLKGGVGKTTIVCFLATAIEDLWRRSGVQGRILVVDTDPQGSATDFFLPGGAVSPQSSMRALFPPFEAPQDGRLFHSTRYPCIDLLPAHVDMADVFPDEAGLRERALAQYLQNAAGGYRLILIDTPPSDTLALRCALMASSGIFMPIDPSRQSLKTFGQFARTFVRYRRRNNELKICGVVFSRYDRRLSLDNHIREAITQQLKNSGIDLYEVPRRAAIAQSYNDYRGFEALDPAKDAEVVKVFADMALKILSM